MFAVEEMIIEENRRIMAEGRAKGRAEEKRKLKRKIIKMAKEMKKNNITIELIEKITGLTRKEIEG